MIHYFTQEEKSELDISNQFSNSISFNPGDNDGGTEDNGGEDDDDIEVDIEGDGGRGVPAVPDKK